MDWVRKFVDENLILLLSKEDLEETIKIKKKDFFNQHSLKSSESFSMKDVAVTTINYLVRVGKIHNEENLRATVKSSFLLSKYLPENQIEGLIGLLKPVHAEILKIDEIKKLNQEGFRQKKEQELMNAALKIAENSLEEKRKKAIEEIQEERQKLEEIRRTVRQVDNEDEIESDLDSLPIEKVTDFIVQTNLHDGPWQKLVWWKKIGLTGDPFPTTLGLTRIPEDKYEQIIVHTDIFKEYVNLIEQSPQTFYGQTILITGRFGSGKTTLINYILYKLANYGILPLQVVLESKKDIETLREQFYSEIINLLAKSMRERGLADPRPDGLIVDKNTIAEMLTILSQEAKIDGFAIMLDGLHKDTAIDISLEFVKRLQNFQEYLNNQGLNVTIFIAGSPYWMRNINQDDAFGGSFFRKDEIPPITFDEAYELINRRFSAFSVSSNPIYFEKSTVRFAYDCVVADQGSNVTFRAFINYLLPKLRKGEFKELGISVALDLEEARKISAQLASSAIKRSYSIFREETSTSEDLRKACYFALQAIYKKTVLTEHDPKFVSNRGSFKILRKTGLIEKITLQRGFGWRLSSDFIAVLENLAKKSFPPEVVFQTFSIDTTTELKRDANEEPLITKATNFLAKHESEWPELKMSLSSFIEKQGRINNYWYSGNETELCLDCRNAMINLIECGQLLFKDTQSPEDWLRSTWLDIPVLQTLLNLLKQKNLAGTVKLEYYHRYNQCAIILLEKLEQLIEANEIVNITSSPNGISELRVLYEAASFLVSGELDKAVEKINSDLEKKIRTIMHISFSLHFGSNYLRCLPEKSRQNIVELNKRGPQLLRRSVDKNLFYHLSRSEYSQVVNEGQNWNIALSTIFPGRTKNDVVNALQLSFALDDREQHRDRLDYFRQRKEFVRQAIVNAEWLFRSLSNALTIALNPPGFNLQNEENYHDVRVSFIGEKQTVTSALWRISLAVENDISSRLLKMSRTVDFSDDLTLTTLFNGSLAEILIIMVFLLRKNLISIQKSPEGNMFFEIKPKES